MSGDNHDGHIARGFGSLTTDPLGQLIAVLAGHLGVGPYDIAPAAQQLLAGCSGPVHLGHVPDAEP